MSLSPKSFFRWLPIRGQVWLKKLYYPHWIRRFKPSGWPPFEGARALIAPGDTVVDVGANIGYVSFLLSRLTGGTGRVIGLEPVPETFEILASNARKLRMSNVRLYSCAASADDGPGSMEIPAFADGRRNYYESRVVQGGEGAHPLARVELRKLDTLLKDLPGRIHFVKIDAEGHEMEAVLGAEALLRRDHPHLLIEAEGDPDAPDSKAHRLFRFLEGLGYQALVLANGKLVRRQAGQRECDYFFCELKNQG